MSKTNGGRTGLLSEAGPTLVSVIATLIVSIVGPVAAFFAMRASDEPLVKTALQSANTVGMMDLYVQLITVYSALVALIATGATVLVTNEGKPQRWTSGAVTALAFVWFVWLFTMGGAAGTPLRPYIPTGDWHPGDLRVPPFDSLLTQTRVAVAFFSLVLGFVGLRPARGPDVQ